MVVAPGLRRHRGRVEPVWIIPIPAPWWPAAQYVAAIVFLVAGWLIRVPIPEEQRR